MTALQILILAVLQGAAELLPVSSSAHVIVAEKLMHIDPSTPEAMFLLAMLHTGTMFAVLIYFWSAWKRSYFSSAENFRSVFVKVVLATAITGIVGYLGLVHYIEHHWLRHESPVTATSTGVMVAGSGQAPATPAATSTASVGPTSNSANQVDAANAAAGMATGEAGTSQVSTGDNARRANGQAASAQLLPPEEPEGARLRASDGSALAAAAVGPPHGDIEELSRNTPLMAGALAVAGVLIIVAGLLKKAPSAVEEPAGQVCTPVACWMGLAQAFCLPFRGLSRSGTTISTGLLGGAPRRAAEEFSFALVLVITPAIIGREVLRLKTAYPTEWHTGAYAHLLGPGMIGLVLSFLAGLAALRWLSRWLEQGKWHYFGIYCLVFAAFVLLLP